MRSNNDFPVWYRSGRENTDFSPGFWLASAPATRALPASASTALFTGLFLAYPLLIGASLLLAFMLERNLFSPG